MGIRQGRQASLAENPVSALDRLSHWSQLDGEEPADRMQQ
jgi:nuclear transport factor 2 (NTF2) superfamily protein